MTCDSEPGSPNAPGSAPVILSVDPVDASGAFSVFMQSTVAVAGFQFDVELPNGDVVLMSGASDGLGQSVLGTVSVSQVNNIVLGVSLAGTTIPPQATQALLTTIQTQSLQAGQNVRALFPERI